MQHATNIKIFLILIKDAFDTYSGPQANRSDMINKMYL